ncbi:acyltransferase family protein [Bordetella petrii]|uniref:acyltransferase family protein n=1 Tax=Bordetella petrii TaxID=94624 RepID=UPI003733943E
MKRIELLDLLRGLAIIGVVFHHLFFAEFRYGLTGIELPAPLTLIASSGWLGVNLFFFLSGLVLYLPYARGDRDMARWVDVRQFYAHRARRLLPLYYLAAIVALSTSDLTFGSTDFWRAAADYAFVLFPFHASTFMPPGNWVLWSIGVEIWFSVLFPAVLLAARRYGIWRVLTAALLIAFATRWWGRALLADHGARLVLHYVADSVVGRLDEFVYGMAAAHLYARGWRPTLGAAAAGVAACALSLVLWGMWYRGELPYMAVAALNLPLDAGLVVVTLALLGLVRRPIAIAWPVEALGMMCYSVYVWHGALLDPFRPALAENLAYSVPYVTLTLAVAALSYRLVEFRGRAWADILPPSPFGRQAGASARS